jgi:RNA polymerase sigma-70 factor (ECF subfamily)
MTDPAPPPDEELLRRIAAGDADAMAVLFRRRQGNVYRFALHLTGSPAVADDVTQDVFIAVIRDAHRFEPGRAAVAAWLCGIARNFVRRRLTMDRAMASLDDDDAGKAVPAVTADPLDELWSAERIAALKRGVLSLPLRYREAVVLCDLQEMSYVDAAQALGCPVGTVRSRLSRGRSLLTAKMLAEQRGSDAAVPWIRKCLA